MMPELVTLGFGVLALMAVWKFILRPSIQDAFKDSLFDVRERAAGSSKAFVLAVRSYMQVQEDETIRPSHTELLSQVDSLCQA